MAAPPVQRTRSGKTVRWDDRNLTNVASSADDDGTNHNRRGNGGSDIPDSNIAGGGGGGGDNTTHVKHRGPGEHLASTHHEDYNDVTNVSSDSWKRFEDIDDEEEEKYWARLKRRESESHIQHVDRVLFGNAATHRASSRLMRLMSDPKLVEPPQQPVSIPSESGTRTAPSAAQAPADAVATASESRAVFVDAGTNTMSSVEMTSGSKSVPSSDSRPRRRGSTNPPMIVNSYPALGQPHRRNSDSKLPPSGRATSPAVFQRDLFLFSPTQSTTYLPTQGTTHLPSQSTTHLPTQNQREEDKGRVHDNDDDSLLRSGSESELARLGDSDFSSLGSNSVQGRRAPPRRSPPAVKQSPEGGMNPPFQDQPVSGNPQQPSQRARPGQLPSRRRLSTDSDSTGLFKPTQQQQQQQFPRVMYPSSSAAAAASQTSHPSSNASRIRTVNREVQTIQTADMAVQTPGPSSSVADSSTSADARGDGGARSSGPGQAGIDPDKSGIDPTAAAAVDNNYNTRDPPSPRSTHRQPSPPGPSSDRSRQRPHAEPNTRKRVGKGEGGEARYPDTSLTPPLPDTRKRRDVSQPSVITVATQGDTRPPETKTQQISQVAQLQQGAGSLIDEGKSDSRQQQAQNRSGDYLPPDTDAPPDRERKKGDELFQQQRRYNAGFGEEGQSTGSKGTTGKVPLSAADRDAHSHKAGRSTHSELHPTPNTAPGGRGEGAAGGGAPRGKPAVTLPGASPLKSGTNKRGPEKGEGDVTRDHRGATQRQIGDTAVSNDRHLQHRNAAVALAQSQPERKHAAERAFRHHHHHSGPKNTQSGAGTETAAVEHGEFSQSGEDDGVRHGVGGDAGDSNGRGSNSDSRARTDGVNPDGRRPSANHQRQNARTIGSGGDKDGGGVEGGGGGGHPQSKFLRETTPVSLHSKAYLSESVDTFRKPMSRDSHEAADPLPDSGDSLSDDSGESADGDVMRKSLRALSAKIQLQKVEADFRKRSAASKTSDSDLPPPQPAAHPSPPPPPGPARKMSGSKIPAPVSSGVAKTRSGVGRGVERQDVTLPKITSKRGEASKEESSEPGKRNVEGGGPSRGDPQRGQRGRPSLQGGGSLEEEDDLDWTAEVDVTEEYAGGDTYVFYLQTDDGELVGPLRFDVEGVDLGLPASTSQLSRSQSEAEGLRNRQTGSHGLNEFSSRSHSVLTVTIDSETQPDAEDENLYVTKRGKLSFVDLAGSEKVKDSSGGFGGPGMLESNSINKSLLVLGNCISHLGDAKRRQGHIPYRDSKLTKLLSDSLAGNGITLMIACITPSSANTTETMNTLRYASRAKKIKSKPTVKMDPREKLIMNLKREIKVLRNENHYLRQQLDFPAKPKGQLQKENDEKFMKFMKEQKEKESGLYEMLQEYMVENESLRAENSEMHSMRDRIRREQQLLYRENEKLMKRVEEMEKVMMQNPGIWTSKQQHRTDGYGQYDLVSPRGSPVASGYQSGHKPGPVPMGVGSPPGSRGKVPGPMRPPHRLPDPVMRPAQRPVELIELENGGMHPGNNGFVSPRAGGPRQTSPSRHMERGPSQVSTTDAIHSMNEQLKKEVMQLEGQIRHHQYVHERSGDLSRSNGHSVR